MMRIAVALLLLPVTDSRLMEYDFSTVASHQSPRALQTSGGTLPDLIAPSSSCYTMGGLEFGCDIFQRIGSVEDYSDLNATVYCELGVAQFDFRRANGCQCSVIVTPSNASLTPKLCPCFVCPVGFGSSSISIDCTEYYEIQQETDAPTPVVVAVPDTETTNRRLQLPSDLPVAATTGAPTYTPTLTSATGSPTSVPLQASPTASPVAQAPTDAPVAEAPTDAPVAVAPTDAPIVAAVPTDAPSTSAPTGTPVATGSLTPLPNENELITENSTNYDPFIFATCVSIDCAGNCNGTCSLGCDVAGPQCAFCNDSPTSAPTGADGDELPTAGGVPNSSPSSVREYCSMFVGASTLGLLLMVLI